MLGGASAGAGASSVLGTGDVSSPSMSFQGTPIDATDVRGAEYALDWRGWPSNDSDLIGPAVGAMVEGWKKVGLAVSLNL